MRPLLMLSLPNSGSTWFAALLAKHIPGCKYFDKEFFNPVCNIKHERVLQRNFGCELVGCYRNIALAGDININSDIIETWFAEDYSFTKECNSAFKLPTFVQHFNCFAFLRGLEHSFPPGRVRVWSFYEHAWWALKEAGFELRQESLRARAMEAHVIQTAAILRDADLLGVPIIRYEDVFTRPADISAQLREVCEVDDDFAEAIAATAWRRTRGGLIA